MIRIAISQAAFDAIASTLALGSTGFENKTDEHGESPDLASSRGGRPARAPCAGVGESYSDVILRIAELGEAR